ncbi:MAG TPA: GNAT family N-acetyltransferase [Phenylobacterium sp.]|jgi:aminoglycoside 6'-N-acetyltransferase|nr:GNAT family N-acetyltransferase [Phenylobacterium sp.]
MDEAETLRIATAADATAIGDLTREAYAKWVPLIGREPLPMTADYVQALKDHRFDLLEVGGELAALIETTPQDDELLIVNVAVRPAFQGRGFGVRLLRLAEELAAEAALKGTRLYTNQRFEENIALYASLGYAIEREEPLEGAVRVHMVKPRASAPSRVPADRGGRAAPGEVTGVTSKPAYLIRAFTEADLPLVQRWRAEPHVIRWWGAPDLEDPLEHLEDPRLGLWIVELAGRPFAFIQDYEVHAWPDHPFAYLPKGARGMDLFIGEPDLLGQGHGARFLRQHVDQMFAAGVPAAGIDPHPDNAAARRSFGKAGFRFHSGPVETAWNRAVLMDREATPAPAGGSRIPPPSSARRRPR